LQAYRLIWQRKDRQLKKGTPNKYYLKIKGIVLNAYSNGSPSCRCCGESRVYFLSVDHINGDGAKHRKSIGTNLYRWLINNKFPVGFQVLCHNCNIAKRTQSFCPCGMQSFSVFRLA
jgi:hypothetical protein